MDRRHRATPLRHGRDGLANGTASSRILQTIRLLCRKEYYQWFQLNPARPGILVPPAPPEAPMALLAQVYPPRLVGLHLRRSPLHPAALRGHARLATR